MEADRALSSAPWMYSCLVLISVLPTTWPVRVWKQIYMDSDNACDRYVPNDDMAEGDVYVVKSDSVRGGSLWDRRPAECSINFNLGDRLVAINLIEWWCDDSSAMPFLAVYDNCHTKKGKLLARFNCSTSPPQIVHTSGPCVSLYHYRGHTKWGYYFAVEVTARHELIAFPAGGIAAIVIVTIVVIMIGVKIICVLSGWESRYPEMEWEDDMDEKSFLTHTDVNAMSDRGYEALEGSTNISAALDPADSLQPKKTQVLSGKRGQPVVTFADEVDHGPVATSSGYKTLETFTTAEKQSIMKKSPRPCYV